jgi:hypothetical protein
MCQLSEKTLEHLGARPTEYYIEQSYSIQKKIHIARELYANWSTKLLVNLRGLLDRLDENIKASNKVMMELGIIKVCTRCDEEEGGSCCGRGMENKFHPVLLIINLLLGVELPKKHNRLDSCYFLSEKGCTLKARLVLCVDFLCPGIMHTLTHNQIIVLQNIYGDELVTCFLIENKIKQLLSSALNP